MTGASPVIGGRMRKALGEGESAADTKEAASRVRTTRAFFMFCPEKQNLQRNAALPWDKVVLPKYFSLGARFSAGKTNHGFENRFTHLLDRLLPGDNRPRIYVNDVRHAPRQIGVRGNLDHRRNRVSGRCAEPGRKEHDVRTRANLGRYALHVVSGSALQIQASLRGIFRVVDDRRDW